MKNKTIKDILFYIALIPYAVLVFLCIYYAIVGYGYKLGKTAYGFEAIGNFLPDVFSDILDKCLEPVPLCILVLWGGYQLYYFISFKSAKKVPMVQEENEKVSKKISLRKILFWISIACWVAYFASGFANGMDALADTLLWNLIVFSVIPILPITLLYIVIYVIVNLKEKKKC